MYEKCLSFSEKMREFTVKKGPPCMTLHSILVRNFHIFLTVQMDGIYVCLPAKARHPMPTTFSFWTLKSVGSERKSH
jgi:hypothetical protein